MPPGQADLASYPIVNSVSLSFHANEERKQRVLSALKEFAKNIIKADLPANWNTIEELKPKQAKCQPYIDAFRQALLPDRDDVITSGYILLFIQNILLK